MSMVVGFVQFLAQRVVLLFVLLFMTCSMLFLLNQRSNSVCQYQQLGQGERLCPCLNQHTPARTSFSRQDRHGYLIAFHHYEQQTQAMRNYLQLQCLAYSYRMRVVEPFLVRSFFSFPFDDLLLGKELLSFGELIDLDLWNNETYERYNYYPVAKWSEFLQSAPRQVIVVCIQYRDPPQIKIPTPGFDYRTGCHKECFNRFKSSLDFLQRYGFSLVQQSCVNFVDYAGSVTTDSFMQTLLGNHDAQDVTVLMTEFRGFYGLYRLPVMSECGIKHHKPNMTILPSARIMKDIGSYVSNVIHGQSYAAILVRVERIVLHLHYNITMCVNDLVGVLDKLRSANGIRNHFLAMDVGKFGSQGSQVHHLLPHGEKIFKAIYGDKWSFQQWEKSFEDFGGREHAAYVANFQRAIAAKSQCLVMVGGGGFQRQARDFYFQFHQDPRTQCVYKVCQREQENNYN